MTTSVMAQRYGPGTPPVTNRMRGSTRPYGTARDCGCRRASCPDDFAALASADDPAGRAALRDRIIEFHLDLAYGIAGRYRAPGPGFDDIRQVAALALVQAVNRFDPSLGTPFSAFAVPTVIGTIKRHFRDHEWTLHPPRRIKELCLRIRAATDLLTQRLRRNPTVADLAEHLGCSQQEIREALHADDLRPLSIDVPVRVADDDTTLADTLSSPDSAYTHVDDVETLRPLLAELPERERRVITMRFVGNLTQSQIAEQVGCSQMQVARILRTALGRLRRGLQTGPARNGNLGDATADRARHAARRPDQHRRRAPVSPPVPAVRSSAQPASSTRHPFWADRSTCTGSTPDRNAALAGAELPGSRTEARRRSIHAGL